VAVLGATLVGVAAVSSPADPAAAVGTAPAQAVPVPTVVGASPTSGPVAGGTVVTVSGTGFAPGEMRMSLVLGGGERFRRCRRRR
jgi:hypothetical protein